MGFRDGFLGLAEDRWVSLNKTTLAGILTIGGTILGTSREKVHRMEIDGRVRDMTDVITATYRGTGWPGSSASGEGGPTRTRSGWSRRA